MRADPDVPRSEASPGAAAGGELAETELGARSPMPERPLATTARAAVQVAQTVLQREADAIQYVAKALERDVALQEAWDRALTLALRVMEPVDGAAGKIVLVGVGIVARKIASTLLSLGTTAVFLHPVESFHGDLGLLTPGRDLVLAMSYSGNTPELLAFMRLAQVQQCARVAMTANGQSVLAELCDVWLDCRGPRTAEQAAAGVYNTSHSEAWPAIPAPTNSTIITMAMGDAFAMALTELRGLTKTTFFSNHPGGNLGQVSALGLRVG